MSVLFRLAAGAERLANWRLLAFAAAVFTVFAALLFGSSAPFSIRHVQAMCGQPPPDVRFYTSALDVHGFLIDCGVAGRLAYRNLQLADLFYPAVNGVFMASALAVMLARVVRRGSVWLAAAALPLLGAVFDYLENSAAWISLWRYPAESGTAGFMLGIASMAKQTISWTAGLLLIGALAIVAVRGLMRRKDTKPDSIVVD